MGTQTKFLTDFGLQTSGDLQVDGDTVITGNLTVNGTSITIDSTTVSISDSMFELASGNTSTDTLDIGIYGNYNDGLVKVVHPSIQVYSEMQVTQHGSCLMV
jgi:hypothetical protein